MMKIKTGIWTILLSITCLAGVNCSREVDEPDDEQVVGEDEAYNASVMTRFVKLRHEQLAYAAKIEGFTIDPLFDDLFDAMVQRDSRKAGQVYREIRPLIGQYARRPGDPDPDPALNNEAWQYALDVHGPWLEFDLWPPELLRMYAEGMLASIPEGAIYFGGTDPGRFLVTAYHEAVGTNNAIIITQNALADNTYMGFARRLYEDSIELPSHKDCAGAFKIYVDEVASGKRPKNAQIKHIGKRVQVTGARGVMEINGIIAKMIFDMNKDDRAFCVEESYTIKWMFPYLTPSGLILRLNAEPTPLTDDIARRDHMFWDEYEKKLREHSEFEKSDSARKTFSKLRSAIAGVYASRRRYDDAEKAFRQAIGMCSWSPEASYRLASEVFLVQKRYEDARQVLAAFREHLPEFVNSNKRQNISSDLETEQKKIEDFLKVISMRQNVYERPARPE